MLRTRQFDARAVGPARLWAEIDLDAICANVAQLRAALSPACKLIAVVKADGYGHGAVAVARAALAAGADELGVADATEGVQLRTAGLRAPIVILGPSAPADAAAIIAHTLVPTVADRDLAAALAAAARGRVDFEVEVDTGMRRHGVPAAEAVAFVRSLRVHPALRLRGLFTHFAGLEAAALPELRRQFERFVAVRAALRETGLQPRAHACNTLATLLLPQAHLDAVRIGGGLYGFDAGAGGPTLRPAMTLKTRIAGLRRADAGDPVGYGGVHRCRVATTLALLPCGYADGLSRAHWNGADVLVRGHRVPIIGHVSMNQAVVDVGALPVEVGDEVVLLGAQGGERLCAESRAAPGCSAYEVTALLRAERRIRNGVG